MELPTIRTSLPKRLRLIPTAITQRPTPTTALIDQQQSAEDSASAGDCGRSGAYEIAKLYYG
jgi:hypothetical protein